MNIIRAIRNLFHPTYTRDVNNASEEESSPVRRGEDFSYLFPSGGSLAIATVYRCVRLVSESVANLPLQYMRYKDGIFQEDTTSVLHYLLTVQPNENYNAYDFWKQVVQYVLLRGNAYIVPVYGPDLELTRLVLCDSNCVSHDIYNDIYIICDVTNGISGKYGEDEIIHIKNFSIDGKNGVSVLTYAERTISIANAGDAETLNRFKNGGNVRGIVSNGTSTTGFGEYQDKQLKKVAASLDERFQAGERIVNSPKGTDFKQISLSSTDMQFLESRKFTVRDLCRFFGVHPSFVFDDTSNNYKSAEMANVAFLSNTLNPMLRQIEIELLRKLVAKSLCCKRKFLFDRRGLYACDLASKVDYQTKTIANGTYTINDWRKEENLPAVKDGDTVLVSANLKNINEPGKPIQVNNKKSDNDE